MRVVLGLAVWALSLGMTYLVGDIAYSSDINKYMDSTNLVGAYIIGSLVIALVYSLWYILRKEQRILDIVVPVTVLLGWGLARRKLLYAGGKGMVYSIAYDLKKVYGKDRTHRSSLCQRECCDGICAFYSGGVNVLCHLYDIQV